MNRLWIAVRAVCLVFKPIEKFGILCFIYPVVCRLSAHVAVGSRRVTLVSLTIGQKGAELYRELDTMIVINPQS